MQATYPAGVEGKKGNPSIQIYGNRIHADQSLYEYLIEFLLVFSSAKEPSGSGKLTFHQAEPLTYYVEPRNGFRRFIFFDGTKKNKVIKDEELYEDARRILEKSVQASNAKEQKDFILAIQELFRGYAAVLKKRTWCAQELLPMCPEMIFCEQMPNDKVRKNYISSEWEEKVAIGCDPEATFYDSSFDLVRHNFLARGGEIYYLHLLQVLEQDPIKKCALEGYLNNLLTEKSKQFSMIANWIQDAWVKDKKIDPQYLIHPINMGYIPAGAYIESGKLAVDELLTFLSNELHPVKRIELLAKGVMYQIMRMQLERTAEYLGEGALPIIIDMRSKKSGTVIRQISEKSFIRVMDAFTSSINKCIVENRKPGADVDQAAEYSTYLKAKKESMDVFRTKGKELQCIIPAKGAHERFSLSEDVTRFIILSIVKPGERMDLNHFLREMYVHFHIVIGPDEYIASLGNHRIDKGLANCFIYNREAFQSFLKSAGFLRDLSDATSIVVNPYKEVELT